MSNIAIDQVLAQIRSLSAQAGSSLKPAPSNAAASGRRHGGARAAGQQPGAAAPRLAQLLKQGIDSVNQSQQSASALAEAWERGTPGVDLAHGDDREPEGVGFISRADRSAQPPGERVPGHHEHVDLIDGGN